MFLVQMSRLMVDHMFLLFESNRHLPNLISDRLCDALIFIHSDESNSGMQIDKQEDNLKWYNRFFKRVTV
jgi:hypothetical protein